MAGVDVAICARVIEVALPSVEGEDPGRGVAYLLNDDSFEKRVSTIPGYMATLQAPGGAFGSYFISFDVDNGLSDDELVRRVRQAANLSRNRKDDW